MTYRYFRRCPITCQIRLTFFREIYLFVNHVLHVVYLYEVSIYMSIIECFSNEIVHQG